MAQARLPARIYGPDGVDVAYEPWRVTAAERLRVGPSRKAPVVLAGREEVTVRPGLHFGRQSERNPDCDDHPRLRRAQDGFVWGYVMPPGHRKSGWLSIDVLEPDRRFGELACGPAGADFDRRRPRACGPHCDGDPIARVAPLTGATTVTAREVYLRWSPRGTAFRYLVRGDRVRRLCRYRSGAHDYTAVEVAAGRWAPAGTRGWVLSSALRSGKA